MDSLDLCVFCQELHYGHPNIFYISQGHLWAARWDNFPARAGHIEIIPTRHCERFQGLTTDEASMMMLFAQEIMTVIERVVLSTLDNLTSLYRSFGQRSTGLGELSERLIAKALHQAELITASPDGWTIGMADGEAAGQNIKHLHLHVIPRWWGDVPDPHGHIRRVFPDDPLWQ